MTVRGDFVKTNRYVRIAQIEETLVVSPLFTFATISETDIGEQWRTVVQRVGAPDVKHVIVDLGAIPYFGSTVLEWMVQMWRRTKAKGGNFAACNCSPIGLEILAAARFDQLWKTYPTRDEALAAVAGK